MAMENLGLEEQSNEDYVDITPTNRNFRKVDEAAGRLIQQINELASQDAHILEVIEAVAAECDKHNNSTGNVHGLSANEIVSGVLSISNGGTGKKLTTSGGILVANGTSPVREFTGAGVVMAQTAGNPEFGNVPVKFGGTGATSAEKARDNLGITSIVSSISSTIEANKTEANTKASTAESNAKTYCNNKSTATLKEAKEYADTKAGTAESNAKNYAESIGAAAEDNSKAYTDTKSTSTLTSARAYAALLVATYFGNTWSDLTLNSGFTVRDDRGGYIKPQYRTCANNIEIRGGVNFTTNGKDSGAGVIATLPEGYRPSATVIWFATCQGGRLARISVSANGNITLDYVLNLRTGEYDSGSSVWIDLHHAIPIN